MLSLCWSWRGIWNAVPSAGDSREKGHFLNVGVQIYMNSAWTMNCPSLSLNMYKQCSQDAACFPHLEASSLSNYHKVIQLASVSCQWTNINWIDLCMLPWLIPHAYCRTAGKIRRLLAWLIHIPHLIHNTEYYFLTCKQNSWTQGGMKKDSMHCCLFTWIWSRFNA